ncbi:MAG: DUF2277 domain-containing protein [Chloroflexota bacterium]|nr:DUF2277 domain-containing protein [Chloroflexota bacterium]
MVKTLRRLDTPATDDELHAAALQFVRKISGYCKPSRANEEAFNRAVDEISLMSRALLESLVCGHWVPARYTSNAGTPARKESGNLLSAGVTLVRS